MKASNIPRRKSRAVMPKSYFESLPFDLEQDAAIALKAKKANKKGKGKGKEKKNERRRKKGGNGKQDGEENQVGEEEEKQVNNDAKIILGDRVDPVSAKKDLQYELLKVEASFMPNAIDLGIEERYLVTMKAQDHISDQLQAAELGDITRPRVKEEASFARFLFIKRLEREIERERAYRLKKRSFGERLRKVIPPEPTRFDCVRIQPGAPQYRNFVIAFDESSNLFEKVDIPELTFAIRNHKIKLSTLNAIVEEHLNPICKKYIPTKVAFGGALIMAGFTVGGIVTAMFVVLGLDIPSLAKGDIYQVCILLGGFFALFTLLPTERRFYRNYCKKRWQAGIKALEKEITIINQMLSELEVCQNARSPANSSSENQNGGVILELETCSQGEDPYFDPTSITHLLQEMEVHRRLQRQVKKIKASNAKGDASKFDHKQEKAQTRQLRDIHKSREKMTAQYSKTFGATQIIKRLCIRVEDPPFKAIHKNIPIAPQAPTTLDHSEDEVAIDVRSREASLASSSHSHQAVDICLRCESIERFSRDMGLTALAGLLCKSAKEDEDSYQEYQKKKLAKLAGDDVDDFYYQEEQKAKLKAEAEAAEEEAQIHPDPVKQPLCKVCKAPFPPI